MDVMEIREQVRMQEWSGLIKERNASGMTIKEWCRIKGTSESTGYERCAIVHILKMQRLQARAERSGMKRKM